MTDTCGTCGKEIRTCEECGGLICVPGCKDRVEDGCTCEASENSTTTAEEDDTEGLLDDEES